MKAVWLNTIGAVFEIWDDEAVNAGYWRHNLFAPGDTIRFVEDDDETYVVGEVYAK